MEEEIRQLSRVNQKYVIHNRKNNQRSIRQSEQPVRNYEDAAENIHYRREDEVCTYGEREENCPDDGNVTHRHQKRIN